MVEFNETTNKIHKFSQKVFDTFNLNISQTFQDFTAVFYDCRGLKCMTLQQLL